MIKLEMYDRCAAGTGKFLEIMAHTLGYSLDQFRLEALGGFILVAVSRESD